MRCVAGARTQRSRRCGQAGMLAWPSLFCRCSCFSSAGTLCPRCAGRPLPPGCIKLWRPGVVRRWPRHRPAHVQPTDSGPCQRRRLTTTQRAEVRCWLAACSAAGEWAAGCGDDARALQRGGDVSAPSLLHMCAIMESCCSPGGGYEYGACRIVRGSSSPSGLPCTPTTRPLCSPELVEPAGSPLSRMAAQR